MPPTLLFQRIGNLVLAVQSACRPADAEWAAYVDVYRRGWHRYDAVRILVITYGGSPSNLQQRQVNELVPGMAVRVAVVDMANVVEPVVRRLIIVNDSMRMFPPDGLDQALDFLEVGSAERAEVLAALVPMQAQIAGTVSS